MNSARLDTLRFFALIFLLVGLGGLIASATISNHYLEAMPRVPTPAELRVVPRSIHGVMVYQTPSEDRFLTVWEYAPVGIFLIGLTLLVIYLEKWGSTQTAPGSEEEPDLAGSPR
jgi:hypothetical protein